jgi:hypothetical protein
MMNLPPLDRLAQRGPQKVFSPPAAAVSNGTQDAVHWVTVQQHKKFQ